MEALLEADVLKLLVGHDLMVMHRLMRLVKLRRKS